jgi:sugar phosphate isomerase/epimerase
LFGYRQYLLDTLSRVTSGPLFIGGWRICCIYFSSPSIRIPFPFCRPWRCCLTPYGSAPTEVSSFLHTGSAEVILVDARTELTAARELCRLLNRTGTPGTTAPVVAVINEGGLVAVNAEWDVDEILLPSTGAAEIDARLRLLVARRGGIGNQQTLGEVVFEGRTALHPDPAHRRAAVQGPPRRPAHGPTGRVALRPHRQHRARPGYRCATGHPARIHPLCPHRVGARDRAAVHRRRAAVPGAGTHRPAQGPAGLDAAAALAGAAHPAQPAYAGTFAYGRRRERIAASGKKTFHPAARAVEMHPHNVVYNPATTLRLATEIDATHVGAEMDPSHLFWQGIDPIAAVEALDGLVYNAAAKDTRINEAAKVNGVLDDRHGRVQPDDPKAISLGGRYTLSTWPENSSWDFVAVGRGHDVAFWGRFLAALQKVDPDMAVNIEHEDAELGQLEGLQFAAKTLLEASRAA